jgi:cob(I)alamin adenosyltransferase
VDELNSHIGVLLCEDMPQLCVAPDRGATPVVQFGRRAQRSGFELLKAEAVLRFDTALVDRNAALPKLQEFILPAGSRAASLAHCAAPWHGVRACSGGVGCRRSLEPTPAPVPQPLYLMFVLARVLNRMNGGDDVYWKSQRLAAAQTP